MVFIGRQPRSDASHEDSDIEALSRDGGDMTWAKENTIMTNASPRLRDPVLRIMAAIVPISVAVTPITVQPAMVQGMIDYMHLSEVHAGYVASAELGGLTLATVLFAFVGTRMNWRVAYAAGMVVMIAGNLTSLLIGGGSGFTVLRTITGFGAGLVSAIAYASVGRTRNPSRNYGWSTAMLIGYSALVLWAAPALFNIGGYKALIITYAAASALCLPLVVSLPQWRETDGFSKQVTNRGILFSARGLSALVAVVIFFIGYATPWTYMALLGSSAGLDEQSVANILSISQFGGIAGALAIVALSGRVREVTQFVVVLTLGAVGIFAFLIKQRYGIFLTLNFTFQFAWSAGQSLMLGVVASRDPSGRLLRFAIPLQFMGTAAGPSVAASLLGLSHDYAAVMSSAGMLAALSLIAILPILLQRPPASVG
jgi:predicted MFS family arabinose efflux permease